MKNFQYCIWLIPEPNHPWYNYTDGFLPHITLKYYLSKKKAQEFLKSNDLNQYCTVRIQGSCEQSSEDNFVSLSYSVETDGSSPSWWPDNAHISFRYQYNKLFTPSDIEELDKQIKHRDCSMYTLNIAKCDGHYSKWKLANS